MTCLPDHTRTIEFPTRSFDNGTVTDHLEAPEFLGRIDLCLQLYRLPFRCEGGYTADIGG